MSSVWLPRSYSSTERGLLLTRGMSLFFSERRSGEEAQFWAARAAPAGRRCRVMAKSAESFKSMYSELPGLLCSRGQEAPSPQPKHVHCHLPPRSLRASGSSRSPRQAEGLAGKAGQEQAGLLQAAPRATPGAGTLPPLPQLLASLMLIIKKPLCVSGKRDSERGTKPPAAVCLQTTQLSCEEGLKAVIVFN